MTDLYDPQARAAVRAWIEQQFEEMERSSYYQLLGISRDALEPVVRDAYYKLVARFHPDLYVSSLEVDTREKLVSMYSRIVEAYQILTNGAKRQQYDQLLARGKLRWTADEERSQQQQQRAVEISNPHSKRLFALAQNQLRTGDVKGAVMNLKMALTTEPNNEAIKSELAKAEARLKGG